MNILCIGDIVGAPGREVLEKVLEGVRKDLAIDFVISHIGTRGIWVMDRGFDDEKRFEFLDDRKLSWVIRA